MKYENVRNCKFISRKDRFTAYVEMGGEIAPCHVKNTGRLKEILLPDTEVYVQEVDKPERKTKYDLIAARKGDRLINIDSIVPNWVIEENMKDLFPQLIGYEREKTYKNSRFDFYVQTKSDKIYVEIKGVTQESGNIAMFPDAPTARGIKHVEELIDAVKNGHKAYIIFVVQMKDVAYFTPNGLIHKEFADILAKARDNGVNICAYDCIVKPDEITLNNNVKVVLSH
ncbi:MAG: DNA/RNA nuclease SfsA [Clostridiaceae bacterium]|nr:DNA/RNA nuclease SfsA [Clostridiaceae bacterium]